MNRQRASGFTLIELLAVMVILGIVVAIGSSFLVTTVDSYRGSEARAKLIGRGRVAIEQMTRQLRLALPNSLRTSASGNCIEFFPLASGANYMGELPDDQNGAPLTNTISMAPAPIALGSAAHVVVGGLLASDIYAAGPPSARASIASLGGSPATTINLAVGHRFIRNSINKRVFIADNPQRFCLSGGSLVEYSAYGLDVGAITDAVPGGATTTIMSFEVAPAGTAFALVAGSENRNAAVNISLAFSGNNESVQLNQTVLVRNVP